MFNKAVKIMYTIRFCRALKLSQFACFVGRTDLHMYQASNNDPVITNRNLPATNKLTSWPTGGLIV
jgi:hypothetical protein